MPRTLMVVAALVVSSLSVQAPPPTTVAAPTPEQSAWQDLSMGMFIHFAPNTWQDREYDDLSTPLSAINPEKLDTDQWVDAAIKLGARYIVFVAKHAGGFCMWPTATTDYAINRTAWRGGKGDVLADLAASCRKRRIALGVYLSPQDARHGAGTGGRCKTPEAQEAYNAIYREQLSEVLGKYGPLLQAPRPARRDGTPTSALPPFGIIEVWFDGSLVVPVGDILDRFTPRAMVFQGPHATIRWVGNEDGYAPYPAWNGLRTEDARTGIATALHGDPDGEVWRPNEVDVSLRRPNWFWSSTNHTRILSVDQLMEIYYRSVGRGANLLLNVTPDRTGLIPAADVARLEEFGTEIRRRFGRAVAECQTSGNLDLPACGGSVERIDLPLEAPATIDHVVLQESTAHGERVREYALEGRVDGTWMPLGTGTAIGQMRIQPVGPRTVDAVRLRVVRSASRPLIRRLAVFATHAAPPKTWNDQAAVWSADSVGRWKDGAATLDLTKKIDAAGQYRVRLVPEDGRVFTLAGTEVRLGGVAQPELIAPDKSRRDSLVLTVPGLGQPIELRLRVEGSPAGTVLLQKM